MDRMRIYATWAPGLPESPKALKLLKDSGIISGVELCNTDGQADGIRDAGLEVCYHNPGSDVFLNLGDPGYRSRVDSATGRSVIKAVQGSDSPYVSVHCGYAATGIKKVYGKLDVDVTGDLITDRGALVDRFADNLSYLEKSINDSNRGKRLSAENVCLHQHQSHANSAKEYVTCWDFIGEVADKAGVWVMVDVSHAVITANTLRHGCKIGTEQEYFDSMIETCGDRVRHLHFNAPEVGTDGFLADVHKTFSPGEKLNEYTMGITREVLRACKNIGAISIEIYTNTSPEEHAKITLDQAGLLIKRLGLT